MTTSTTTPELVAVEAKPVRLDLGCGTKKKDGFVGVDRIGFPGVDVVCDLGKDRWPWNDNSVGEAHSSHLIEHLEPMERVHFANELFRVLTPGAKAHVAAPHWCSTRAYGDMTHKWPPVAEAWMFHLQKSWRDANAPHETHYTCDFEATASYSTNPALAGRSMEYVMFALSNYKESAPDILFTLTKPVKK